MVKFMVMRGPLRAVRPKSIEFLFKRLLLLKEMTEMRRKRSEEEERRMAYTQRLWVIIIPKEADLLVSNMPPATRVTF